MPAALTKELQEEFGVLGRSRLVLVAEVDEHRLSDRT